MKLSIVIPAYETGELLRTAVGSVTAQPFDDWELIIVDDGSKDTTPALCDRLAAEDSRIKVIHTPNRGAYMARLTGAEAATGEWVMFMDSDDSITPGCITGLFGLVSDDVDIVVGTININNQRIYHHRIEGKVGKMDYIEAIMLLHTTIGNYSKLYRRSLFDNVHRPSQRITNNEDMLLLISLALNARKVRIDNSLVCYNYIFREASARTLAMSVDRWQLLFDSVGSLIGPLGSRRLDDARLRMILDRAYRQIVLGGTPLPPSTPFMRELTENVSRLELSAADRRTLAILRSPARQRLAYRKSSAVVALKQFIKKILRIR